MKVPHSKFLRHPIGIGSLAIAFGMMPLQAALETNKNYLNGIEAMANRLPELAAERFKLALTEESLTSEERRILLFTLAEAQVRAMNGADALVTLSDPLLESSVEKTFWVAHAYYEMGRLEDAVVEFSKVIDAKNQQKSSLALSALVDLYRSLGRPDAAYEELRTAAENSVLSETATFQLVEFYLEKKDILNARTLLESLQPSQETTQYQQIYLSAQIDLADGKTEMAKAKLEKLREFSALPLALESSTQLLYSEVLIELNQQSQAIQVLEQAIEKKPDSPYLFQLFNQLLFILQFDSDTEIQLDTLVSWFEQPNLDIEEVNGAEASEPNFVMSHPDRDAYARYVCAFIIENKKLKDDFQDALSYLENLRILHPAHNLVISSYELSARLSMELNDFESAKSALAEMQKGAATDEQKARATLLLASLQYSDGEEEAAKQKFKTLIIQQEAESFSKLAGVNLAVIRLIEKDYKGFYKVVDSFEDTEIYAGLLFEQALVELNDAKEKDQVSKKILSNLESLVEKYPNHALADDARLELSSALITYPPYDGKKAAIFLAAISENAPPAITIAASQLKHRVAISSGDWNEVIETYENQANGSDFEVGTSTLTLAEAYYRNGQYVNARREFNKIIQAPELERFHTFSYFFSALAAKKEGTPQGKLESDTLFMKVIETDSPLKKDAYIHYSRSLIDQGKFAEVVPMLEPVIESMKLKGKELKVDTAYLGLNYLLAEALQRVGLESEQAQSEESIQRAVAIYDYLLKYKDQMDTSQIHETLFLKGEALQNILSPSSQTAALNTYYQVVNLEFQPESEIPLEWIWYYKCGFKAVDLLEGQERYEAAISLLEKMASTFGPKSSVLTEQVEKLKLKHLIW
ncbi:hypothetical protein OAB00_01520 [Akkermansiaceae bacterium]|nr:hypothetical protein [Akkermansiaceae bacterium]